MKKILSMDFSDMNANEAFERAERAEQQGLTRLAIACYKQVINSTLSMKKAAIAQEAIRELQNNHTKLDFIEN